MDHPDYFTPLDADEIGDQHTSAMIFPELDEDCKPSRHEWLAAAGYLRMACGCSVEVYVGDIVWMLPGESEDSLIPIAVDPTTIH